MGDSLKIGRKNAKGKRNYFGGGGGEGQITI